MPWGFLILFASGLLVGWGMLVVFTAYLLSHAPRRGYSYAVARNLPGDPSELLVAAPDGQSRRGVPFEQWTFRSRGADLPVWDIRGENPAGPIIIVTHGWGDSRVVMLARLGALAPLAARVVMWDLPGHGDSPKGGGFTLGAREDEDLLALVETLAARSRRDDAECWIPPIVLFGASLGAGASIVAAAKLAAMHAPPFPRVAVIAEAPYRIPPVPARNVFRIRGMPYRTNLRPAMALLGVRFGQGLSWACSPTAGRFDRALHAAELPSSLPLLVLHGSLDPICPVEDGQAIAAAAPEGRLVVVEKGGHNNLWIDPAFASQCAAAVRAFLDRPHTPHANRMDATASATAASP